MMGSPFTGFFEGFSDRSGSRGPTASGTVSEGNGGLSGRAYHLYLETGFALYVACVAARFIDSYGLDVIIERETAFGAGAIASRLTGRPMVLEMIGPDSALLDDAKLKGAGLQ